MKIAQAPSPNFNARANDAKINYIVLHYTGMKTAEDAIRRLRDPSSEVSAHYVVDEDGSVLQLVDEKNRAWHAEKLLEKLPRHQQRFHRDRGRQSGHLFGYRPFPQGQLLAVRLLAQDIKERYALPVSCVLAHSDVSPDRKMDPGEFVSWKDFAEQGLGLWPVPTEADKGPARKRRSRRPFAKNRL